MHVGRERVDCRFKLRISSSAILNPVGWQSALKPGAIPAQQIRAGVCRVATDQFVEINPGAGRISRLGAQLRANRVAPAWSASSRSVSSYSASAAMVSPVSQAPCPGCNGSPGSSVGAKGQPESGKASAGRPWEARQKPLRLRAAASSTASAITHAHAQPRRRLHRSPRPPRALKYRGERGYSWSRPRGTTEGFRRPGKAGWLYDDHALS